PRRGQERARQLVTAAQSGMTVVFFESALRLVSLLEDLMGVAGPERRVAVARELTKIHEELRTGPLAEVAGYYREHPPKGEVTVVLDATATSEPDHASEDRAEAVRERARTLL